MHFFPQAPLLKALLWARGRRRLAWSSAVENDRHVTSPQRNSAEVTRSKSKSPRFVYT